MQYIVIYIPAPLPLITDRFSHSTTLLLQHQVNIKTDSCVPGPWPGRWAGGAHWRAHPGETDVSVNPWHLDAASAQHVLRAGDPRTGEISTYRPKD